jgi:hypothetical protein
LELRALTRLDRRASVDLLGREDDNALSPNTSSCSVQLLPPKSASSLPAITDAYAGDSTHNPGSGQTHYGPASELASHVELSELGTIKSAGL